VPLPVLVLAAEITACAAFVAWLVHRAHRPAPAPAPPGRRHDRRHHRRGAGGARPAGRPLTGESGARWP